MKAIIVLLLFVSASAASEEPENLFVLFSKCAGVIESEVADTNHGAMDSGTLANIVSSLKKGALLEDSAKSISEFYKYKAEGNTWYRQAQSNETKKEILMYVCAASAQEAMDLVDVRGR